MEAKTAIKHLTSPATGNRLEQPIVTFFMVPGVVTGDAAQDKLLRSHEAEADAHSAEFFNYGWVQGDNQICSKTSQGKLASQIDPTTMQVSHEWL
jgi:hypothetical protein